MFGRRASVGVLPRLLVAWLFGVFVVEQAPHLVHHFFEPDTVQNECPFATASERHPGAPSAAAVVGPDLPKTVPIAPLPAPRLIAAARPPADARAPPTSI